MTHHGWREPTPALVRAEQFALAGERLFIPKSQAMVAVKKIGAVLGLKAADLLLLDTLGSVTQNQDWESGRRPIVWPSNNYLMDQCNFSLAGLKRHIKRLVDIGLISFKDSSNGNRRGYRDDNGYIIEAFGFDLSPLAARAAEFEARYVEMMEERRLCKSLRTKITSTRRMIYAKIDKAVESGFRGPWSALQAEYELLVAERLPKRSDGSDTLINKVEWFQQLRDKVEEAFTAAFDWPEESDAEAPTQEAQTSSNVVPFSTNPNPKGLNNEPDIQTTTQPHLVNSNCFEEKHGADIEPEHQPSVEDELSELKEVRVDAGATRRKSSEVELSTVMAACPEFAELARGLVGGYVRDWNDLHRAAGIIRPMLGISEDIWNVAQEKLGPYVAAAAIALIHDKVETGTVDSAGGYLRGMVGKAISGELYLERSFYGRLAGAGEVH